MDDRHPALVAARNSWRCVQEKKRDEWLALLAEDVRIEDPIGIGPTNPTGKGVEGRQAAGEFWEKNIAPTTIRITAHESYAAGNESAHVMTLVNSFPNGVKMTVRGIFTYRVNDAGHIQSLRGYWSLADAKVEQPA